MQKKPTETMLPFGSHSLMSELRDCTVASSKCSMLTENFVGDREAEEDKVAIYLHRKRLINTAQLASSGLPCTFWWCVFRSFTERNGYRQPEFHKTRTNVTYTFNIGRGTSHPLRTLVRSAEKGILLSEAAVRERNGRGCCKT